MPHLRLRTDAGSAGSATPCSRASASSSCQVESGMGTPSRSRVARIASSGCPGRSTASTPSAGRLARHRGALCLDLSSEPLQVGKAGNIDGQDEWTVHSARAVIARRIHLCQAATDELGE